MTTADMNGRLHWLLDDSVTKAVFRHFQHIITFSVCGAVCRKWRSLANVVLSEEVFSRRHGTSWWSHPFVDYIRGAGNTDADMGFLIWFLTRNAKLSSIEGPVFHAALVADRPSVVRMCLGQVQEHTDFKWDRVVETAIMNDARGVLEHALLPALCAARRQYTIFDRMLRYASLDLFQWYCTRYPAMRGFVDYNGFASDDRNPFPVLDLGAKIAWMTAAPQPWSAYFWLNWFNYASGMRPFEKTKYYNADAAVLIALHHYNGDLREWNYLCSYLTNGRLRERQRNFALHDRLRPFCSCPAQTQGKTKKAKVAFFTDEGGDDSYQP